MTKQVVNYVDLETTDSFCRLSEPTWGLGIKPGTATVGRRLATDLPVNLDRGICTYIFGIDRRYRRSMKGVLVLRGRTPQECREPYENLALD